MRPLPLLLIAIFLSLHASAQSTAETLAAMAAKYDARRASLAETMNKALAGMEVEHQRVLDRLEKKYTEQGNLDGVLRVRQAREDPAGVLANAGTATVALTEVLKRHAEHLTKVGAVDLEGRTDLTRAYLSALTRMKQDLTRRSKIDEALSVSVEMDRVAGLEPDIVAALQNKAEAAASPAPGTPHAGPRPAPGRAWTSPTGIEFVLLRPGTFDMGSPPNEEGRDKDETRHRVTLTKAFWMGRYEVTQAQWEAVMGHNPSQSRGPDLPVEQVSWEACQEFLRRLCEKEGVLPGHYRLPTEAEWEYACRAGMPPPQPAVLDRMAWFANNASGKPVDAKKLFDQSGDLGVYRQKVIALGCAMQPVGRKTPNAWGLHDMLGNAWEWCADRYGEYPADAAVDPVGPATGDSRVYRGGSWINPAYECRAAGRREGLPGANDITLGFRLVRMER